MSVPLAMAGLAEAAEFYSIVLWRGVIGLAVALALWGLFRRSRKIIWIAQLIVTAVVGLVQPWWDFMAHPAPTDPDEVYWLDKWQLLSGVLIAAFLFCSFLLAVVMVKTAKSQRCVLPPR